MENYKFRVWDGKKFHYTPDFNMHFSKSGIIAGLVNGNMVFNNYNEIQQYTGQKDKTKKDVYDQDICDYYYVIFESSDPDSLPLEYHGKGIIIFEEGAFWIKDIKTKKTIPLHYTELSFVIIGNIHENPELLK